MLHVLFGGVLPIFALVAIGYYLGARGIFDPAGASVINRMIFLVAIPALNFRLIATAPFSTFDWWLLAGVFMAELSVYLLAFLVARYPFRCEAREAVLLGMAAAFGNHLLFVLPIAIALFGETATTAIVAIVAVDSVIMLGGTLLAMELMSAPQFSWRDLLTKLASNLPLMSLIAASAFTLSRLNLPEGVLVFLTFAGSMAAPCALFALGLTLSQINISGRLAQSMAMVLLKLIGLPLIAGVILCGLFGFSLEAARMSLLAAAAPCGAMAFVLALNYRVRTDAIAPAILFSTVISVLSVTLIAGF